MKYTNLTKEQLKELLDSAKKEYEQAKQLYAKAGLCCGVLAALVLF